MTAAVEGGEWSAARPGHTLPPGKTRYPFYRRLGGPQGRSGRAENLAPTGIRFRTVQPVAQSLYRLSYPAYKIFILLINKLLTVRNRKPILPQQTSILWNAKFHYHVPNSLWISPVLRQRDTNRNLPPYPFENVLSITLPLTPRLSKWPTLFRCSHQNHVRISLLSCVPHAQPPAMSLIR